MLLNDLHEALPSTKRLGELSNRLDAKFVPVDDERWHSKQFQNRLIYDRHVPTGQRDMPFGEGR